MNESSGSETENTARKESDQALEDRKSDATSKETLSDIQDSEKESGSADAKRDPGPSPDGQLDEPDELKDAGPI